MRLRGEGCADRGQREKVPDQFRFDYQSKSFREMASQMLSGHGPGRLVCAWGWGGVAGGLFEEPCCGGAEEGEDGGPAEDIDIGE